MIRKLFDWLRNMTDSHCVFVENGTVVYKGQKYRMPAAIASRYDALNSELKRDCDEMQQHLNEAIARHRKAKHVRQTG